MLRILSAWACPACGSFNADDWKKCPQCKTSRPGVNCEEKA
jgi:hypothetical protein